MKKLRKIIYLFLTILMILLTGGYYSTPGTPSNTSFTVIEGDTADSVTERLAEQGFVRSQTIFWWELRNSGLATKLQPGEHDLAGVIDYRQIIDRLTFGQVAMDEVVLLVREGETLRDIKAQLTEIGLVDAAEHLYGITGQSAAWPAGVGAAVDRLEQDGFPWLHMLPAEAGLEGFLFPDTYRFFPDASAEDVVKKMVGNFDRKLDRQLRNDIDNSGRTLYEIVIMASILEREVRSDEDRALVADLFWRRLDVGMGLQADSTVNYVIDGDDPSLTYEQTKLDTPYNTYKWRGLPPGPIGNPGLSALRAAIDPTPNDYWYFLTDADGTVHYAKNLAGHNSNKAQYLK